MDELLKTKFDGMHYNLQCLIFSLRASEHLYIKLANTSGIEKKLFFINYLLIYSLESAFLRVNILMKKGEKYSFNKILNIIENNPEVEIDVTEIRDTLDGIFEHHESLIEFIKVIRNKRIAHYDNYNIVQNFRFKEYRKLVNSLIDLFTYLCCLFDYEINFEEDQFIASMENSI